MTSFSSNWIEGLPRSSFRTNEWVQLVALEQALGSGEEGGEGWPVQVEVQVERLPYAGDGDESDAYEKEGCRTAFPCTLPSCNESGCTDYRRASRTRTGMRCNGCDCSRGSSQ